MATNDDDAPTGDFDPYNINSTDFNPDLYLQRVFKEYRLTEIMDREQQIHREVQLLDSEMQRLVYDNYNKFISATDTIKKMKTDFQTMEQEMESLVENMSKISVYSGNVSQALHKRAQQVANLNTTSTLLNRLQRVFELPENLRKHKKSGQFGQAVVLFTSAESILSQYSYIACFKDIHTECLQIVDEIKAKLLERFEDRHVNVKDLSEAVQLLNSLHEPIEKLCAQYLEQASISLNGDLEVLVRQVSLAKGDTSPAPSGLPPELHLLYSTPMDVQQFVDHSCNSFLGNISLIIASYAQLFVSGNGQVDSSIMEQQQNFVRSLIEEYFKLVAERIEVENRVNNTEICVKALDKTFRRIQALNNLLPQMDLNSKVYEIIQQAATNKTSYYLDEMKQCIVNKLGELRHELIQPFKGSLPAVLVNLEAAILEKVKHVLWEMRHFVSPDVTFASSRAQFRSFTSEHLIKKNLLGQFINFLVDTMRSEYCDFGGNPLVQLVLSKLCLDLRHSLIRQIFRMCDDAIETQTLASNRLATDVSDLVRKVDQLSEDMLQAFVVRAGDVISNMLRKSVDARNWVSCAEPRNVRAVMKRVVEDLTQLDMNIGELYEEGSRRERSSDSSRRTYPFSQRWGPPSANTECSLMSNLNFNKLFTEKIEIMSKVEPNRISVMTGIIKISLKTLLECIRLKTFGKFGLQQVQVDAHYLHLYLWRFVQDEQVIFALLDEIVSSAIHRCLDPILMEQSVVEVISDRG
ncbi:vacuolar protein sorting-associated protein 51 homolog [Galendromus occidentalis]|uniref:Vacuolar protein sorting-associated protein 51 homolog n=1 Tax=Galendromus occidentalis TaxID=34638 RepID=A0AAJ6QNM6_9ACAR|nr:vacuolar protein sorting-associated protein 51 homolog [Galendromus occidentalis]